MLVLKTTSPTASPSAPKPLPSKVRPSASARIAFIGSIERGSLLIAQQSTGIVARIDDRIYHRLISFTFLLDLAKFHAHPLIFRAWDIFADIVRFDRNLTMTAIDQDRQANRFRSAGSKNDTEGAFDRSPGKNHVVDENHLTVLEIQRSGVRICGRNSLHLVPRAVNLNLAQLRLALSPRLDLAGDTLRQTGSDTAHAQYREPIDVLAIAQDLLTEIGQRGVDFGFFHEHPLRSGLVGLIAKLFSLLD